MVTTKTTVTTTTTTVTTKTRRTATMKTERARLAASISTSTWNAIVADDLEVDSLAEVAPYLAIAVDPSAPVNVDPRPVATVVDVEAAARSGDGVSFVSILGDRTHRSRARDPSESRQKRHRPHQPCVFLAVCESESRQKRHRPHPGLRT
jgi:hypothetical protein